MSIKAWLMWLSGFGTDLHTKRLLVQFPVRVHAWVTGQIPGWGCAKGNPLIFLSHIDVFSLSLSLPSPLSENK